MTEQKTESLDRESAVAAIFDLGLLITAVSQKNRLILSLTEPGWSNTQRDADRISKVQASLRSDTQQSAKIIAVSGSLTDTEIENVWRVYFELHDNQDPKAPYLYHGLEAIKTPHQKKPVYVDVTREVAVIDGQPIPFKSPAEFAVFNVVSMWPVFAGNTVKNVKSTWKSHGGDTKIAISDVIGIVNKRLAAAGFSADSVHLKNGLMSIHKNGKYYQRSAHFAALSPDDFVQAA